MKLRMSRRLAVVTGAAVLGTAMSGTGVATARTLDTFCGPEIDLGAVVYQTCSEDVGSWSQGYGTQPYIYAKNRGIVSADVSITIQRWNYATSSWNTTATGTHTIGPGGDTYLFSTNLEWSCGQDSHERGQLTNSGITGDWSEAVVPAVC